MFLVNSKEFKFSQDLEMWKVRSVNVLNSVAVFLNQCFFLISLHFLSCFYTGLHEDYINI